MTAESLSAQAEDIQEKLKEVQRVGVASANDLLVLLSQIRSNVDGCVAGHKQSLDNGIQTVDSMRKHIAATQQTEALKFQEEIRNKTIKLDSCHRKVAELEAKLESNKKLTSFGQQQIDQIKKLEQQRLASSAEATVMRKARDELAAKLDGFTKTIGRIAALRKRCATQGKSLADEIGESTALQLNDLETKQKASVNDEQKKLDAANAHLKEIENSLSEAYEQECLLRDEQQKSQTISQNESLLQMELQEEQKKLAEATAGLKKCQQEQKSVSETLQRTEDELLQLKKQFDELYEKDLARKHNQEQLVQQLNELQRENMTLEQRLQAIKPPTATANVTSDNVALQEAREESDSLRVKLQSCTKQIGLLQTNLLGQQTDNATLAETNQYLNTQIDDYKRKNLALHKKNDENEKELETLKKELEKTINDAAQAAMFGQRILNELTQLRNA